MEPEKIGILDLIKGAHSRPSRFAEPIARMTLKMIIQDLQKKRAIGESLSLVEMMASANQHPTAEQVTAIKIIVAHLIREHATGKLPEGISIDTTTRDNVARACMALLGDKLHSDGHTELAHYIHNTPHIGHVLSQPERLQMLEHGIIPDNRIFREGDTIGENDQFWIGHDAKKKYEGREKARIQNIVILLQRADKTGPFEIFPILQGDKIHMTPSQIVLFQGAKILVHDMPKIKKDDEGGREESSRYESNLLASFDHELDEIDTIESLALERTPWHMHRITGKKNQITDGVSEAGSMAKSVTLVINNAKPELSYTTNSKRYKIGKQGFTIDTTSKEVILLRADGIEKIPFEFKHVHGVYKYNGEESLYFIDQQEQKRKMGLKDGEIVFEDATEGENEFFEKKK